LDIETENNDHRLIGLVTDITGIGEKGGRVSKSVSTIERYNRWGQHYLRCICRAHQLQLRINFMDPGLQVYGGAKFVEEQDIGGKIFITLPMTKKVTTTYTTNTYTTNTYTNTNTNTLSTNTNTSTYIAPQNTAPQIDNTTYYGGGGGGCFDESCFVTILSKNGKLLKSKFSEVKKNDLVRVVLNNGELGHAKVLCVVKINLGRIEKLVEFPSIGLKLTKKHPVWFNNQWQAPIDIANKDSNIANICDSSSKFVYNLVLEHSHVALVNGMRCVTLGHGIKEAYHPFYGTMEVINVVKAVSGYEKGIVEVNESLRKMEIKGLNTQRERLEEVVL